MTDESMAYAAYCGECDGMIAVSVHSPEYAEESAKFVAGRIRRGQYIKRVTCQSVRDGSAGAFQHREGCTRDPRASSPERDAPTEGAK